MKKKLEALRNMAYLGQCYKTDLALMVRVGTQYECKLQKQLIDAGWLREKEVVKPLVDARNPTASVVAITNKGKAHLCDELNTEKFMNPLFNHTHFNISESKRVHRYLGDNRIMIIMHKAGIRTFPYEKPSLYHMYMHLSQEVEFTSEKYDHEFSKEYHYDNTLNLNKVMNDGVYYSIDEFRQFVRHEYEGRMEDSFQGCRFRGVLVTKDQIILVYLSNVFDNKRIKLTSGQEERGIGLVEDVFSVFNRIKDANALVISSGNALVVDMAICGREGVTNVNKGIPYKSLNLLDNSCDLFEHIYVIPHNMAGVDSLDYIAHHTFKQWQKDSRELFEEFEGFELIPEEFVANKWLIARDVQKDIRAIYVPYYDIKMLEFFHKFHEDITIVTYEDMAETISHSIRRKVPIYNVEGELLEVNQYQLTGRLVGSASINNEKKRKKTLKHIGVNVSAEEKKMIEKMTKANGTSISYYIRKLIRMHLNEDYDQYLKSQQLERNNRKK